jgi:phosphoserine phosphatase
MQRFHDGARLRVLDSAHGATTAYSDLRMDRPMPERVRRAVVAALDARRQALASEASNSASFSRIQAVS